jgi:hypothetical protein
MTLSLSSSHGWSAEYIHTLWWRSDYTHTNLPNQSTKLCLEEGFSRVHYTYTNSTCFEIKSLLLLYPDIE